MVCCKFDLLSGKVVDRENHKNAPGALFQLHIDMPGTQPMGGDAFVHNYIISMMFTLQVCSNNIIMCVFDAVCYTSGNEVICWSLMVHLSTLTITLLSTCEHRAKLQGMHKLCLHGGKRNDYS